jgi:membrane protein
VSALLGYIVNMSGREIVDLVKGTVKEWQDDQAPRLAAALSYYTVFSLAPILVIVIAIAGLLGGQDATQSLVMDQVADLLGEPGREFVETMISSATIRSTGIIATGLGVITLLFGALGAFNELQYTMNRIWDVKTKPVKGMGASIKRFITARLLSFSMLLAIGFLLLVSLVVSAALAALREYLGAIPGLPELALQILNIVVSLGITTLLFALMFKYIPDIRVPWRSVWLGAALTAIFFTLGRFLIGLYLGRSDVGSTFGAAGSLALILLWIYYSAQIVFLGAEFTQVYSTKFGEKPAPKSHAEARGRKPGKWPTAGEREQAETQETQDTEDTQPERQSEPVR